ncbi:fimbrial biogenesis outer membrane usher protein [Nissabacter sp. SGAir0207]|nr:fimbrial biogenesis outer membrane usher protein [Nissabacter sp. SGAir0207]
MSYLKQSNQFVSIILVSGMVLVPVVAKPQPAMLLEGNSDANETTTQNNTPAKKPVKFNTGFIAAEMEGVDLSAFDGEGMVNPGIYPVEVTVNGKEIGVKQIRFAKDSGDNELAPCLSPELIIQSDVNVKKFPADWKDQSCVALDTLVPGSTHHYDTDEEALALTFPQASLLHSPNGYVSPELWDNGVPSLAVNYSFSASDVKYRDNTSNKYLYGNALTSLKWGAWRLYTYDSVSSNDDGSQWDHMSAYVQRAIAPLEAEFQAGDIHTSGQMFDSISLRGAKLATDDRMWPDSMRGYAPVVRGVADTNAQVTVRQNGNVIKELTVPPGEFVVDDLYATGYGGDLEVTITEATGQVRKFIVPYSSVPMLLRAGYSKFSTSIGEVRNGDLKEAPVMMEATYQYGLNNLITAYGGGQVTADGDYASLVGGFALNTPVGALGMDLTRSFTSFDDEKECDRFCQMSLKISLAKVINETNTSVSLAGYRYSSSNYYTLMDAMLMKEAIDADDGRLLPESYRDKIELNISQSLPGNWGSLFISGYYGRVWDSWTETNKRSSYQVGYSNAWRSVSYSINLARTYDEYGEDQDSIYLSFSVPFGTLRSKVPKLNATVSYSDESSSMRASLNGTGGEYNQFNFGGWMDYRQDHNSNLGINLGYSGSNMQGSVGYSQTEQSYTASVNASGGVVFHGGGVNFTSSLGDTFAIVEAKGATGAHVYPELNKTIDKNGYAIISSLSPYQFNDVYLDTKGAPAGVEVDESKVSAVPTAGAALKLKMATKTNVTQFVRITHPSVKNIPYGSAIKNESGEMLGMIGQGGRAMLDLPDDAKSQVLTIDWKHQDVSYHCRIEYAPSAASTISDAGNLVTQELTCQP